MSGIQSWMGRTRLLLGDAKLEKLIHSHVLVTGLGGVGGICAEMIARSGVKKMTLVDGDVVEETNRNRQAPAYLSTEGRLKTEIMAEKLLDINPDIDLKIISEFRNSRQMAELLDSDVFDYAVDAIDTLSSKVWYIKECMDRNIPLVSSMGAGGKVDPTQVQVCDISKTYNDKLAYYVRKRLHRMHIYKGLKVVFSPEKDQKGNLVVMEQGGPKRSVIGTISYMPAVFGCMCAGVVVRDLYNRK
jgi:tRNA A37 threonylcarbamoyladenosine dehydratase